MNKPIYKMVTLMLAAMISITLASCGNKSDEPVAAQQAEPESEVQTTVVTDENYAQAETEIIFADLLQRIADASGTNGMAEWLHLREGADPKDHTVCVSTSTRCTRLHFST